MASAASAFFAVVPATAPVSTGMSASPSTGGQASLGQEGEGAFFAFLSDAQGAVGSQQQNILQNVELAAGHLVPSDSSNLFNASTLPVSGFAPTADLPELTDAAETPLFTGQGRPTDLPHNHKLGKVKGDSQAQIGAAPLESALPLTADIPAIADAAVLAPDISAEPMDVYDLSEEAATDGAVTSMVAAAVASELNAKPRVLGTFGSASNPTSDSAEVPVLSGGHEASVSAFTLAGMEHEGAIPSSDVTSEPRGRIGMLTNAVDVSNAVMTSSVDAESSFTSPLLTQTMAIATPRPAVLPYTVSTPEQGQSATVSVQEGRFGSDIGIEIARAVDQGSDDLLIRLDPRSLGRIDVRLAFDHDGILRAVMSADSAAALDLLRREGGDLARALADAGVRADNQSLRFDSRSSGQNPQGFFGQNQQNNGQSWSGGSSDDRSAFLTSNGAPDLSKTPDEPDYRPLASSGHVNLMA